MGQLPETGAHLPSLSLPASGAVPQPVLGVRTAVALIVGIVIGAGIFKAPSMVADIAGSPGWMFGAWAFGGVISLIGALCYAELATAYAHAGGDYHFLRRAYGAWVSFLFAWARFAVITTGSIALLAFVFGDYMTQLMPLGGIAPAASSALYGSAAILVLSWINLHSFNAGTITQGWLTALEIGGLLLIVVAALAMGNTAASAAGSTAPAATSSPTPAAFGMAMVFVLLTFGGWNEAAYFSAELKNRQHAMVKALVWSIVIITVLYLLVTWAYWHGLGLAAMAKSDAIAADLMRAAFGPVGGKIISVVVAITALTSINATILVGARTSYAVGCDWPALGRLALWDGLRGTPTTAMRVQCVAALLLVLLGAVSGGGFKSMVEFTAPVFWLFFLLSGLSLFILRVREPATERPFQVPLFPLLPLLFCLMCGYMLWSSLSYVSSQSLGGWNAAWIGVAVLMAGLVLLFFIQLLSNRTT